MCNCKRDARLYQELAQAMDRMMQEHKAYKRQRKEIVQAINELAQQVEEHEAILEEMYAQFASHDKHNRKRQQQHTCKRCKAAMHRCKRCGR